MPYLIRPNDETVPDHFHRFPFGYLMSREFLAVELYVPLQGIEPAPVNHNRSSNEVCYRSIFAANTKSALVKPSTLCVQIVTRTFPHAR